MVMSHDVRVNEEESTQRRASVLGIEYYDTTKPDKAIFKQVLPISDLQKYRIVPLFADEHNILFGLTTTTSQQTIIGLRQRFQDQRVNYVLISDSGFHDYMLLYDPPKQIVYQNIDIASAGNEDLVKKVSDILEQIKADDMLAYLVQQAHNLNASDIHFENESKFSRIRFRIDGVLHPIAHISFEKAHILISAIASGANISTASIEAQQGHISEKTKMADGTEVNINLRVETVPAVNGMDIVMRLFNMDQSSYSLDRLGLSVKELQVVEDIISKPSGLVMVVGPTGSGKTTTLYSILQTLNTDENKIITIEDPVEYQFEGITQISVSNSKEHKATFAEELRAVLRLDPDIVMVGEIRDADTAKTALQGALTGHLVLSTFHASSAAAALTRIMDIVEENPLFLSAIRLIMAQRLVRRLDDAIKQPYTPDAKTLELITRVVDSLPPDIQKPNLVNLQLYKPGKSIDNPYGYKGQIALREQFLMHGPVLELLQNSKQLSTDQIEESAIKSGMTTMLQEGILKVINGETSLEEVYRVVG